MKPAVLLLIVALSACSSQPVKDTAESPKTFAVCRTADVATTAIVLHQGGYEANPLMAHLLAHGWLPLVGFQGVVVALAWNYWDTFNEPMKVTMNAISCAPVAHNLGQIK